MTAAADRASSADWPAIESLLLEAGLPLDGAAQAFERGVVARDRGRIVAAAAIEPYGRAGLLRSVVVAADRRGAGLGGLIVAAAEGLARGEGIDVLYLMTETAEGWFPRLGYAAVDRATAEAAVGGSVEFTTSCRDRGITLRRRIA